MAHLWRSYKANVSWYEKIKPIYRVSDDNRQFKAHKVVLCASSPWFRSIIGEGTSNPFIYLRGIQSDEVESILQFIYLGKATFYHERMNEFLNVAKNLEIKEISKENPDNEQSDDQGFEQTYEESTSTPNENQEQDHKILKESSDAGLNTCDQCDKSSK